MGALTDSEARVLMADLLAWPQRESKPEWWQYFERRDRYDLNDFLDDSETIGDLRLEGQVRVEKRSVVWRYRFDPDQDCKTRIGEKLYDPLTQRSGAPLYAGAVTQFDPIAGLIELKRGEASSTPHPLVLMPKGPVSRKNHGDALRGTAAALLEHGTDGPGSHRAGRRLVGRHAPSLRSGARPGALRDEGESTLDAAIRLVDALDESVLPVQGPPGSGKTYTAARVILHQVSKGRKVGITGPSHAAINKLIDEVLDAAASMAAPPSIVKKADSNGHDQQHGRNEVRYITTGLEDEVAGADIVAGTSWAFAHPDMSGAIDLLLVDEAGQMSLADVVAIARSARNLVLFGDPMQLAQPTKGTHPGMAGLSALEHLCAGSATVPEDAGLLLDVSWRMHPAICGFISEQMYDGRLSPRLECSALTVADGPLVSGAGLRWMPINHSDNRTSSMEEVLAVAALCDAALGRQWTDATGATRTVDPADILVVTPYNAQANLIRQRVPNGVQVGTVDMFQGREAAIVVVSLAASALEDIPRGIDFLLSKNRLNVAISRAKALCVVVASPALLTAHCTTLSQIRLVNTLCRYVESAVRVSPDPAVPGTR